MTRIDGIFAAHRQAGTTALMPFITAGHPTLATTRATLPELEQAGASIVELGFPFSDPIADGPVIAASMHAALEAGLRTQDIFDMVSDVRAGLSIGLIAMVSDSIIMKRSPERFIADAAAAGFDGLIIPDIDLRDADHLRPLVDASGMSLTLLVAPNSSEKRVAEIVSRCSGFVYLLARAGITGEQSGAPQIADRVALIRSHTKLPIAVGFGISTPEHVRVVSESADAAIVGSALVRRMAESDQPAKAAGAFIRSLAGGLREATNA